jgi:diguanylate cyclase (GGDEF)-like protein
MPPLLVVERDPQPRYLESTRAPSFETLRDYMLAVSQSRRLIRVDYLVERIRQDPLPLWFAVCASTVFLCLGQFQIVEGWQGMLLLNTGGIGLISSLGLSELRRRGDEEELRKLREVASTDPLTGAGNRRWFDQEMNRRVTQFRRYGNACSLLIIDVDHFKSINDTWGHDVGDHALKAVTKVIAATLRDTDLLFRVGGEEFAALLPETELSSAITAAERIRIAVGELMIPMEFNPIQLTVSVGGAQLQANESMEVWFKRADKTLYRAKQNGRNQSLFDFPSPNFRPMVRAAMEGEAAYQVLEADHQVEPENSARSI